MQVKMDVCVEINGEEQSCSSTGGTDRERMHVLKMSVNL